MTGSRKMTRPNIFLLASLESIQKIFPEDSTAILVGLFLLLTLIALGIFLPETTPYLSLVRIPLALVYVLFIPGYLIQVLFFPYRGDLDGFERFGLSLGLSLSVVSILALFIDRALRRFDISAITCGQLGVILVLSVLVIFRRLYIPGNLAYVPGLSQAICSLVSRLRKADRRRLAILLCASLVIGTLLSLNLIAAASTRLMTEFYILGADGLAEDYPREVEVGEPVRLTAGIHNLEEDSATYSIAIRTRDQQVSKHETLTLQAGEMWQGELVFKLQQSGEHQPVDILLDRANYPAPYRALRIWLNVCEQK
jgi:uncharacterized membrane protein